MDRIDICIRYYKKRKTFIVKRFPEKEKLKNSKFLHDLFLLKVEPVSPTSKKTIVLQLHRLNDIKIRNQKGQKEIRRWEEGEGGKKFFSPSYPR